jgi:hypothetical protein
MSEEKLIEFTTIEQIIDAIHLGNKDNFLTDFRGWLEAVINMTQTVRTVVEISADEEQKELYNNMPNSKLVGCSSMKWIDDGKHNFSISVVLKEDDVENKS